jgi:phosphoglycerate dehydrogenase-like enzyme
VTLKVVLQYDAGPALKRRLADLTVEGLEVIDCPELDQERFADLMQTADVLWHVLVPVTPGIMAGAPRLKLVQKIGVGLNTIDLVAARQRGIMVCNMPGSNSRAVAEMTLLLMLAALRRLSAFDSATRRGKGWAWPAAVQDSLGEIAGRTVGLIGYGSVPRLLAPVLTAMGARVLYTARTAKEGVEAEWRTLPALLAESDVVLLHLPLTPETANLLGAAALARMKPGVVLVNTARGGLVDQTALAAALKDGRLAAAGIDVFAEEPAAADNPLFALPNVVVTPHVAWLTRETLERSLAVAVENCRRLRDGRELLHRVA